jgi:hypothetical protein
MTNPIEIDPIVAKIREDFDLLRAERVMEEARDTALLDGLDPEAKDEARALLFLIRNPSKCLPPR